MSNLALFRDLDLDGKINASKIRIRDWYEFWDGDVYVAFSGGKDSTVLLHLVRSVYGHIPGVFNDTGLEMPEIREFVKQHENIIWLKPKMSFKQVLDKYGFPVISKEVSQMVHQIRTLNPECASWKKRMYGDEKGYGKLAEKWKFLIDAPFKISDRCCDIMKKNPAKVYEKETGNKPYIGTMAGESRLRSQRIQCNAFEAKRPTSAPLNFWTDDDIWGYLKRFDVPYCSLYDNGYERTGCAYCLFGAHMKKYPSTIQLMQKSHPKLFKYCMDKLGMKEVLEYCGIQLQPGLKKVK